MEGGEEGERGVEGTHTDQLIFDVGYSTLYNHSVLGGGGEGGGGLITGMIKGILGRREFIFSKYKPISFITNL